MRKYTKHKRHRGYNEEDQRVLDEAHENRQRHRKEKQPTREQLVKDLLRVANDPDNPYYGTCSKERYRKYGWWGERNVTNIFGTHQEFQRAAGLMVGRTASAYASRRGRLCTSEKVNAYYRAEMLPWIGKYANEPKNAHKRDYRIGVIGSDFHGEYVDPFIFSVFLDVIRRTKPDFVCLNGDVADFPAVSRWSKDPRKILNLQQEIDYTRKNILAPVRRVAPEARIDWVIGNHEYRLVRFLADAAPELATLRCLKFSELFQIDELKINLIFGGNFLAPDASSQKEEFTKNWCVYNESYVVTHGNHTGKFPASKEVESFGMSGTSGHVHRPQMHSMPTLLNQHADWLSAGMMCKHEAGDDYVKGPTKWTNGFVFVTIFPEEKIAIQQPVIAKRGRAVFSGKIYKRK